MTQDTRKDRRVKIVSLNVRYKSATVDEFIDNHAYDVSRGGIYIKTASPFPPGTLLRFEIRLASDQAVIAGVGRVVWKRDASQANADHPAGMGVKFIKLDDPSKAVIDKLVNTKADAGKAFEAEAEAPSTASTPTPIKPAPAFATPPPPPAVAAAAAAAGGTPTPVGTPAASTPPRPGTPVQRGDDDGHWAYPPAQRRFRRLFRPGRSSAPAAPVSSPPRPGPPAASPASAASSAMFPQTNLGEDEPKAPQEQTVMKQAAELLEEGPPARRAPRWTTSARTSAALRLGAKRVPRRAGSSRKRPSQRPSPPGSSRSLHRRTSTSPVMLGDGERVDFDAPPPAREAAREALPPNEAERARAMVADMSPAPAPRRSEPPLTSRESPSAKGPSERPGVNASDVTERRKRKKGGSGGLIAAVVFLVAAAGVAVMFREKLFGSALTTPPAPTPSMSAPAALSAASTASATASSEPAASASAMAALSASAAVPSASASSAPSAAPSVAVVAPRPVYQQPRPVVAATGGGTAPATGGGGDTSTASGGGTAPTSTATAGGSTAGTSQGGATAGGAATTTATATSAPAPKPKPKASDDNPY